MAALPTVGGSNDTWGSELNAFLTVSMEPAAGTLKSAAITGGLGYTPVNKAGDTMSGALTISSGNLTVSSGKLLFDGQTAARRLIWAISETSQITDRPSNPGGYIYHEAKQSGTVAMGNTALQIKAGDRSDVTQKTITGATNASPIEITATSHGYATGDKITVNGVAGNTAANGLWTITSTGANTFTLTGSTGNGAYTSGGYATNRGLIYGLEIGMFPRVARDALSPANTNGDDVVAIAIANAGTGIGTEAIYIGQGGFGAGASWQTGIAIDVRATYGLTLPRTYDTTGIRMSGTFSGTGIDLNGTFTGFGLDFYSGTFTTGCIRLKNSVNVYARNAADSANVSLFGFNSINELQFDQIVRFATTVRPSDGSNFTFGTSTGSKIGTGTTQKIGFWNATPVVRGAAWTITNVTTDRSYDANATSIDELADNFGTLVAELQTMGLLS